LPKRSKTKIQEIYDDVRILHAALVLSGYDRQARCSQKIVNKIAKFFKVKH
jgi:hypothetical protein